MVSNNFVRPVVERFLLVSNIIFASVKINDLIVPETVAVSDNENVTLECVYSGTSDDDVVVRWLFNGTQVYEWSPEIEPRVNGILRGKIDLSTRYFGQFPNCRHYLVLTNLTSELSGDYTCVIQSRGQKVQETKTMIVYNPERDFQLTFNKTRIHCTASGLYPQPYLTIEFNKFPVAQQQRIWRNGSLFDAECTATITSSEQGEVACRLQIPQVDYTAIIKKYINEEKSAGNQKTPTSLTKIIATYLIFVNFEFTHYNQI